uniref:BHLH domain-containing protein n=1 Tax=Aegilops tauschii subsp. strangulata TaxID=200361 RepID=A0A453PB88_AEGTS
MALVDALCASSVDNAALVYSTFNAAGFLFDNAAGFYDDTGIAGGPALALQAADRAPGLSAAGDVAPCLEKQATLSPAPPRRKRRRRARSCKSREETECQRMTHIAVERNRRRQMNEYLVVLRSLMPESYVQRVRLSLPLPFVFCIRVLSLRLSKRKKRDAGATWEGG